MISGGGKEEKEGEKEEGEDEVVMNNLMHDIKEGFIQRRLPDGGFKVHHFKTSNSIIMRLSSCAHHEFRCAAYHYF